MICKMKSNVIKTLHLKHVFPFISTTGSYFHFWILITVFSTCVAACPIFVFYELFFNFYLILAINLTSVFITLFAKCFSAVFKNINLNMLSVNKVGRNAYNGENVLPKRDVGFMKVGSLIDRRIYFHVNWFWFFNRIIL